jgi:hypothetical protein
MDPTIAAAWIGAGVGGGVALVGVVGTVATSMVNSNNTRKATERTVEAGTAANRATLVAAREDRLWEKRCAAYEETMAELHHRQSQRFEGLFDGSPERELNDIFGGSDSRERYERQGRLAAYASDSVRAASHAATMADLDVVQRGAEVAKLRDQLNAVGTLDREPHPEQKTMLAESLAKLNSAFKAKITAERALIEVIRDELRSRPEAAMVPPVPALPATRRRFLRRQD